jgi:hypothetical protein
VIFVRLGAQPEPAAVDRFLRDLGRVCRWRKRLELLEEGSAQAEAGKFQSIHQSR